MTDGEQAEQPFRPVYGEQAEQPFRPVCVALNPVLTTDSVVGYMYILVDPIDPHHRWRSKLLTLEEAKAQAQTLLDDFATRSESADLVIAEVRVIERMT